MNGELTVGITRFAMLSWPAGAWWKGARLSKPRSGLSLCAAIGAVLPRP